MSLKVKNISKRLGNHLAVDGVSFKIAKGERLALLGPSGCGKTTTLRLVAGFETLDRGEIWINGHMVSSPEKSVLPHKRSLSMVFQDLALWPHMTVWENMNFAMGTKKSFKKIEDMLKLVSLEHHRNSYPAGLSGGEKQRLALARALVKESGILLLDEPFSSLDPVLKRKLLEQTRNIISGITTIYVTHDWPEAVFIADWIATMKAGQIDQICSAADFTKQYKNFELCG